MARAYGEYTWEHIETSGNVRMYDTTVDEELGRNATYWHNQNKEIVFKFYLEFPSKDTYTEKAEAYFEVKETSQGSYVPMLVEGGQGQEKCSIYIDYQKDIKEVIVVWKYAEQVLENYYSGMYFRITLYDDIDGTHQQCGDVTFSTKIELQPKPTVVVPEESTSGVALHLVTIITLTLFI